MSVQPTDSARFPQPIDVVYGKSSPSLGKNSNKITATANTILARDEFHDMTTLHLDILTEDESGISISNCLSKLTNIAYGAIQGVSSMIPDVQTVSNVIGTGCTVVKDTVSNIFSTGIGYAKPIATKLAINTLLAAVQRTNPLDIELARMQLETIAGSKASVSAIEALSAYRLMKRQARYDLQPPSSKSDSMKVVLEHPYIKELAAHMYLQATTNLYRKLRTCEGETSAQFGIDVFKTLNTPEGESASELSREQSINALTKTMVALAFPNGSKSVDLGGGLEFLDQYEIDCKGALYGQFENVIVRRLATKMYDSIHNTHTQNTLMATILEKMHKAVGSKAVEVTSLQSQDAKVESTFKKISGLLAFKKTVFTPKADQVRAMSSELTKMILKQVEGAIPTPFFKLLTVSYIGVLAPNGILLKTLTNTVGTWILQKLGSVDVTTTLTSMLKEVVAKSIPDGEWEGDQFSFDSEQLRTQIKTKIVSQDVSEEAQKAVKDRVLHLTSETAIQQFIEAVPIKLGKLLVVWGSSLKIAKYIAPYVQTTVQKLTPKVTLFCEGFSHRVVDFVAHINKRRVVKRIGENIRMIPTVGVRQVQLVTETMKKISGKK